MGLFLSETTENLIELVWLEFLTCYSLRLNYPLFMKLRQIEDRKSKILCCVIADSRSTSLFVSNAVSLQTAELAHYLSQMLCYRRWQNYLSICFHAHEALLFSLLNVIM